MRRFVFVLVPLLVFALAACGSDGGRTTGSTGATAAGSDAGESGTAGPTAATGVTAGDCEDLTGEGAVFTIKISFSTFYPDCFTASASQSIKIVNKDDIDHTFTITGTQVDVPVAADETFNGEPIAGAIEPGTYEFQCTIHPQMTGRVTVVA